MHEYQIPVQFLLQNREIHRSSQTAQKLCGNGFYVALQQPVIQSFSDLKG